MKIGRIKEGAEFIEVDCYEHGCRHRDGMPKLVFKKHNGYGTGHYPSHEDMQAARRAVRDHGHFWNLSFWIGRGKWHR